MENQEPQKSHSEIRKERQQKVKEYYTESDPQMDITDIAKLLGVSERTVYRDLIEVGIKPSWKKMYQETRAKLDDITLDNAEHLRAVEILTENYRQAMEEVQMLIKNLEYERSKPWYKKLFGL